MHLEWSIPGIWFMAHLEIPGMNVSGVTLPGVPGIIAGHNDRIAWGASNHVSRMTCRRPSAISLQVRTAPEITW